MTAKPELQKSTYVRTSYVIHVALHVATFFEFLSGAHTCSAITAQVQFLTLIPCIFEVKSAWHHAKSLQSQSPPTRFSQPSMNFFL